MTQPVEGQDQERWAAEVLRRASAVLQGRMVGVWEVSPDSALIPVVTNVTEPLAWDATPEVKDALRHIAMPAGPGTRWVAGRLSGSAHWCVAPVRDRVPAPPPHAVERRSRERLALELAGMCLGLSGRTATASPSAAVPDLFQRFTEQLGTFAQEIAAPLTAARQAVARGATAVAGASALEPVPVQRLAEELRAAAQSLEQAVALVKTVQQRAQAVVAKGGGCDVVQVLWSCVDAARAQAALRGATLELKTLAYAVSVPGSADELRAILGGAIEAAVEGLRGRVGTVRVSVENVGSVVVVAVRSPAADGLDPHAPAVTAARKAVEESFGGTLTVAAQPSEGATLTVAIPAASHRFRDPALWWEQ